MSDYFMVANGFVVFLLCFIVIAFVMFQAVLFMRKAWRQGLALGMSREIDTQQRNLFHYPQPADSHCTGGFDAESGPFLSMAEAQRHRFGAV